MRHFAAGRLVKQNSSVRPFDEHASSVEQPRSLTDRPPKPSLVSALSSSPKRIRAARTRWMERQSASSDRIAETIRRHQERRVLASRHRSFRSDAPRHKPASVAPPEGVAPSSLHEVALGPTLPRPSSLQPLPAFTFSGRALDFRALLRVWVGYDPASLPTRDRPILPWVSDSPPRHSVVFATRSPWPVSSARAAEWQFVDANIERLTVMDSTAGGSTSRHPSRL
jgi:hypothetical protein